VPALHGKWYEDEQIASWLKLHSEKGGRVVLHSVEADGEAWGWEFDGRGRMRALALRPAGKWV
jgi:YD repeat-containing protein